jgi:branched-chain amino acid transport system permease protein
LLAALSSCAPWPDAQRARICRLIIPALDPPESTFEVHSIRGSDRDGAIHIGYTTRTGSDPPRLRALTCRFAQRGSGTTEGVGLVGVVTDGVPLGSLRLNVLMRYWLVDPAVAASDPAPYLYLGEIPQVPRGVALGLQHALSGLPLISIYALLAAAYTLIYGLVGRINLAFGEFTALAGYGTLLAATASPGAGPLFAILGCGLALGVWTALVHGFVAGRLMFAPLQRQDGRHLLIATLGLALALQEYLRLSQGSQLHWVPPILNTPVAVARGEGFVVSATPVALIVTGLALVAALSLLLVMRCSRFGRGWRACADDRTAAMLLGIDPTSILSSTVILASGLAGLAGFAVTILYGGVGYAGGIVLGLKSLIAAIAGGIGSIPGAFLGGLLVGGLEALWSALFPIEYRDLVVFSLLAAFLIWRPGGLLGAGGEGPARR